VLQQYTWHPFYIKVSRQILNLSIRAPLRNLEGGSFTRDLERWRRVLEKGQISLCGSSMRGTWREGSFTGDPEGYAK